MKHIPDYLVDRALLRVMNGLPISVDMEAALVARGFDVEAIRQGSHQDEEFDSYGLVDAD
jgi:hypothetical protein